MGRRGSAWVVALLAAAWATGAWAESADVFFREPPDGAVVEGGPWITVSGRARRLQPLPAPAFDVLLVIDTSGSTRNASGVRWRAGANAPAAAPGSPFAWWRGFGDSILAAEVAAAIQFLGISNPATTRVGVVTFAGAFQAQVLTGLALGVPGSTNAWVAHPLTFDYVAVQRALLEVLRRGPYGGTDMGAGLRLAVRELLSLEGAQGRPRLEARKVALLLTDGYPTLPLGSVDVMDPGDVDAVVSAARIAGRGGIVIHSFCLGPEALSAPIGCTEAARITGGTYTPVQTPADIVNILPTTPIGHVELVAVRNATTGQMARSLSVTADGTFTAELPLALGANRLVVELHGSEGIQGSAARVVHYRGGEVQIEVTKERDRNVEIQVDRPRPPDRRLDVTVEPAERLPPRERRLDLRIEQPGAGGEGPRSEEPEWSRP